MGALITLVALVSVVDMDILALVVQHAERPEWEVQSQAVRALGSLHQRFSEQGVRDALVGLLENSNSSLKCAVLSAFHDGDKGDGCIEAAVRAKLLDVDDEVRDAAVQTLVEICDPDDELVDTILAAVADETISVKSAIRALAHLLALGTNDCSAHTFGRGRIVSALATYTDNKSRDVRFDAVIALHDLVLADPSAFTEETVGLFQKNNVCSM